MQKRKELIQIQEAIISTLKAQAQTSQEDPIDSLRPIPIVMNNIECPETKPFVLAVLTLISIFAPNFKNFHSAIAGKHYGAIRERVRRHRNQHHGV